MEAMADPSAGADELVNQAQQNPDADASAAAGQAAASQPEHPNGAVELDETTEVRIRGAIAELLPSVDLQQVSVYDFRCQIARHLGFGRKGLEASADQVNVWVREAVDNRVARAQESPEQRMEAILEMLGSEDDSKKTQVHFITFSRLLPGTVELRDLRDLESMSREDIACCVWKAFDEPLAAGRGRPPTATELVRKIAVFREEHADGMHHFHVAVLLRQSRSFVAAKRTLRERDHLAAHFSASHTGFWSAVRYGHIPTAKKPEVDATPLSWSEDGGWGALDLFAESQRPWMAHVWKRRHEDLCLMSFFLYIPLVHEAQVLLLRF